ncbi:MAG TPA: hypothetical protein VEQ85_04080 [Lacipirellulaceae bacterium]|nr:hypothetical protein [Lacipirellulaceae bacterium]
MPRPAPPSSAVGPAPAWQTLATVLVILHLFFLGIGLATNLGGGKSLLAPALYRVPLATRYLKLLWMNFGYDFDVATPLPEDGSHELVLAAVTAAGQAASEPLAVMPSAEIRPRIRRRRYEVLAQHVAVFDELYADNADIRTVLPLSIAQRWLWELGAPQQPYLLTGLRKPATRLPKAVERAPSARPREGGPKTAGPAVFTTEKITVYLVWDPETASYQGSRAEPEGQTSEVVRQAAAPPINTPGAAIDLGAATGGEAAGPAVDGAGAQDDARP